MLGNEVIEHADRMSEIALTLRSEVARRRRMVENSLTGMPMVRESLIAARQRLVRAIEDIDSLAALGAADEERAA